LRVQWTEKANRNLDEIEAHIAQDNPEAAVRVVLKVIRAVEQLADSPAILRSEATKHLCILRGENPDSSLPAVTQNDKTGEFSLWSGPPSRQTTSIVPKYNIPEIPADLN
jgi:hypothetical protein